MNEPAAAATSPHGVIDAILAKYSADPYMSEKANTYICQQLPIVLENMKKMRDERQQRMEDMTNDQDTFIQLYLNRNQYFYVQHTDRFFRYDDLHYDQINEDDIIYDILSSISRNGQQLISWKQRTKITIMKKIRETPLLKTIPESETIQYVLNSLSNVMFSTRNETKYFLTILGDNILRKETNIIHYIHPNAKNILTELNNYCHFYFGTGLTHTFKYKYHDDHEYNDCRIVKINETDNYHQKIPIFKEHILDILCVACHYSSRYSSSDHFLLHSCNDDVLIDSVFFLKSMNPENVIDLFMEEYIEINGDGIGAGIRALIDRTPQITWKNMQYLWKHFLDLRNLPAVMYARRFRSILTDKLAAYYDAETDSFIGICSKFLPSIQTFLRFWEETTIADETETGFEIDELTQIFFRWCETNRASTYGLNDKHILDLIHYFYPTVEIEKDKYISGIRNKLWDKQLDIQTALENMKYTISQKPLTKHNISIYDAYLFYCNYHAQRASKAYFEKYVCENLSRFVVENNFISWQWMVADDAAR
jgi:hypothetical protein